MHYRQINYVYDIPIDFRKAFDSVPHYQTLCKFWKYGIAGGYLSWLWFRANLSSRVQCVDEVNGFLSGVLQGKFLSPLLFVLYV